MNHRERENVMGEKRDESKREKEGDREEKRDESERERLIGEKE